MFSPATQRDPDFRLPRQCVWLKLNGSWPLSGAPTADPALRQLAYTAWAWYVLLSVGITICFQSAYLVGNFGDIMMTTENCCTTFMGALNFVRLLHMRLNQRLFRHLIEQFVHDIWIPDQQHLHITSACRQRMKTFSIMTALLSCLILMYCIMPLVELFVLLGPQAPVKPFPYKMLFPYDPYSSWLRYALTYLFTSFAGICVVTTLFAEDSILGFFITYTCGQFRLLHERIDGLTLSVQRSLAAGAPAAQLQQAYVGELKRIARQHDRLMCFARCLEDFFNPILLVNLIISSVLICMVGFQLVTGQNMFIGDYVKFIVYISSSISQLFILCGNGDMLIQHSTATAQHLFDCNWEGTVSAQPPANKEFRTNLQFMILCSQRPVKITAFKFSTLSLQSFTAILSTSMSYFTLLRSIFGDDQH